jgi:hypothetical protein
MTTGNGNSGWAVLFYSCHWDAKGHQSTTGLDRRVRLPGGNAGAVRTLLSRQHAVRWWSIRSVSATKSRRLSIFPPSFHRRRRIERPPPLPSGLREWGRRVGAQTHTRLGLSRQIRALPANRWRNVTLHSSQLRLWLAARCAGGTQAVRLCSMSYGNQMIAVGVEKAPPASTAAAVYVAERRWGRRRR